MKSEEITVKTKKNWRINSKHSKEESEEKEKKVKKSLWKQRIEE